MCIIGFCARIFIGWEILLIIREMSRLISRLGSAISGLIFVPRFRLSYLIKHWIRRPILSYPKSRGSVRFDRDSVPIKKLTRVLFVQNMIWLAETSWTHVKSENRTLPWILRSSMIFEKPYVEYAATPAAECVLWKSSWQFLWAMNMNDSSTWKLPYVTSFLKTLLDTRLRFASPVLKTRGDYASWDGSLALPQ